MMLAHSLPPAGMQDVLFSPCEYTASIVLKKNVSSAVQRKSERDNSLQGPIKKQSSF